MYINSVNVGHDRCILRVARTVTRIKRTDGFVYQVDGRSPVSRSSSGFAEIAPNRRSRRVVGTKNSGEKHCSLREVSFCRSAIASSEADSPEQIERVSGYGLFGTVYARNGSERVP